MPRRRAVRAHELTDEIRRRGSLRGAAVEPVAVSDLEAARDFSAGTLGLDPAGISRQDGLAVAWMRDPDGNIVTLFRT